MRAAIYARVSTTDQNCEMQLRELREYVIRRGWVNAGEYVDTGWSGGKASRPQLDRLMRDAAQHKFDCVLCWKLDRFTRSMVHLVDQLGRLRSAGVRFVASSQSIDTDESNPTSRLLLHILGAVAEFERELIRERVTSGLKRYRDDYDEGRIGKRGRSSRSGKNLPHGRPRAVFDRLKAREMHGKGWSVRAIASKLGVGTGTVQRTLKQ
jgi:DNA invertase Pin-like site-specific DNA recombinase